MNVRRFDVKRSKMLWALLALMMVCAPMGQAFAQDDAPAAEAPAEEAGLEGDTDGDGELSEEEKTALEEKKAAEEAARKAEEERKRKEEEERKKQEEARKKAEAERKAAEEAARKKAEEEARKKAEEERKKAEEEARQKKEQEELNAWWPGYGVGLNVGWLFTDLAEMNGVVFDVGSNPIEPADAAGLLRIEADADIYIKRTTSIGVFGGGMFSLGSDTGFNLVYGGLEPALVFPSYRFELILGLRVGLGAYAFEGTNAAGESGVGYEGLGAVVEPNLTLRYIPTREFWVDFRLGFMQFIAFDASETGGATPLGQLPGVTGENGLDFAAPSFTVGFQWGAIPKRPPQPKPPAAPPAEEEGGEEGEGGAEGAGEEGDAKDKAADDKGGDEGAKEDAGEDKGGEEGGEGEGDGA